MTRFVRKNRNSSLRMMKITFPSFQKVAITVETFRVNRHQLTYVIDMHPDRLHDAKIKHRSKLRRTIQIVDCQEEKNNLQGTGAMNSENPM